MQLFADSALIAAVKKHHPVCAMRLAVLNQLSPQAIKAFEQALGSDYWQSVQDQIKAAQTVMGDEKKFIKQVNRLADRVAELGIRKEDLSEKLEDEWKKADEAALDEKSQTEKMHFPDVVNGMDLTTEHKLVLPSLMLAAYHGRMVMTDDTARQQLLVKHFRINPKKLIYEMDEKKKQIAMQLAAINADLQRIQAERNDAVKAIVKKDAAYLAVEAEIDAAKKADALANIDGHLYKLKEREKVLIEGHDAVKVLDKQLLDHKKMMEELKKGDIGSDNIQIILTSMLGGGQKKYVTKFLHDVVRAMDEPAQIEKLLLEYQSAFAKKPYAVKALKAVYEEKLNATVEQLRSVGRKLFIDLASKVTTYGLSQDDDWAKAFEPITFAATNLSHHVVDDVMSHKDIAARTLAMERWIAIAHRCYQTHDFHSAQAISVGLSNSAVFRLKVTKEGLSPTAKKIIEGWPMLPPKHEAAIKQMNGLSERQAVIPFLGAYQSQVTFTRDTKHDPDKMKNMAARKNIIRTSVATPLKAMMAELKKEARPTSTPPAYLTEAALTARPGDDAARDKVLYDKSLKEYEPRDKQDKMTPASFLQKGGAFHELVSFKQRKQKPSVSPVSTVAKAPTVPKTSSVKSQPVRPATSFWKEKSFHGFLKESHREYYGRQIIDNEAFAKQLSMLVEQSRRATTSQADKLNLLAMKQGISQTKKLLVSYKEELNRKLMEHSGRSEVHAARLEKVKHYLDQLEEVQKNMQQLQPASTQFRVYGSEVSWVAPNKVQEKIQALHHPAVVQRTGMTISAHAPAGLLDQTLLVSSKTPDDKTVGIVSNVISPTLTMHTVYEKKCNRIYMDQLKSDQKSNRLFKEKATIGGLNEEVLIAAIVCIDGARHRFGNQLLIKGANEEQTRAMLLYCEYLASQGEKVGLISQPGGPQLSAQQSVSKLLPAFTAFYRQVKPDVTQLQQNDQKALRKAHAVEEKTAERLAANPVKPPPSPGGGGFKRDT